MIMSTTTSRIIKYPERWQDISSGELYQQAVQQQLNCWLTKLFGRYLLKLGTLSTQLDTRKCNINRHINFAHCGNNLDIIGDYYQLPFQEKSFDACLVSHLFPYIFYPHHLLREIDRILVDDGWLILSGFNAMSLLSVAKLVPGIRKRSPYADHLISNFKLIDWLSLLNYEVIEIKTFPFLPGTQRFSKIMLPLFPSLGCINFIVARKKTIPLMLLPHYYHIWKIGWINRPVVASRQQLSE